MLSNQKIIRAAILSVAVLIAAYTLWNNFSNQADPRLRSGDEAPDFTLQTLDGQTVSLSDYRGKGVILNFWGTFCLPCRTEMPAFQQQYELNKDNGLEILAVNMDEAEASVQGFVNQYGLTFPILMDKGRVAELYRIDPLPTTMLINPDGQIERIILGPVDEKALSYLVTLIMP
jgi:peroxiredoxin